MAKKKCTSRECKRFEQSQAAHERLRKVYGHRYMKDHKDSDLIRNGYHYDVFHKQDRFGRILSTSEKKKVYKRAEYYVHK